MKSPLVVSLCVCVFGKKIFLWEDHDGYEMD